MLVDLMLYILTSKRVLHMTFSGQNHLFGVSSSFSVFFHQNEEEEEKVCIDTRIGSFYGSIHPVLSELVGDMLWGGIFIL